MLFPTATFAVFFCVVLVGAWSLASRSTLRKVWLVAAGLVFYAYWDTTFVLLLVGMVLGNWAVARLIVRVDARRRSAVLALGVVADVAALAVFKYYGFFVDSVTSGLDRLGLQLHPPLAAIALPVGISFYCFQCISYLVDVRREQVRPAGLLDVATWMTFFPTVTSGPITRAGEFLPQLAGRADAAAVDLGRAYFLIARGLLKKLVIASYVASAITDEAFRTPSAQSSLVLLFAVYAYAVQIYVDFSGYTDMAIGLAMLLGFRLPENFNRPYTATSVQDFWSRWHMTLSRWLRDYLFAPMTGRRGASAARVYLGIVAVMLVAGLWHGAAWGFVLFGGVHGVAMAVERWNRQRRRRQRRPVPERTWRRQLVRRVVTFHVVCLGWVFFAAPTVSRALDVLTGILTNGTGASAVTVTPLLLLTVAGVLALDYVPAGSARWLADRVHNSRPVVQGTAFAASLVPILALAPTTVPAFIYYRF